MKETIKVKEFKIDLDGDGTEQSFYYMKDGADIAVFSYDKNLAAYVEMTSDNPAYYRLHEILEKRS